jgi:hypothetical protein
MSTQNKNFLWSYARSFLAAAIALWLANGADIFALDSETLRLMINAGIAAVVPPLLRALNENDPAFGKGFFEVVAEPVKVAKKAPAKKAVAKRTTK